MVIPWSMTRRRAQKASLLLQLGLAGLLFIQLVCPLLSRFPTFLHLYPGFLAACALAITFLLALPRLRMTFLLVIALILSFLLTLLAFILDIALFVHLKDEIGKLGLSKPDTTAAPGWAFVL
jgi:hypothetical protein